MLSFIRQLIRHASLLVPCVLGFVALPAGAEPGRTITREAKATITAVELDHGETLRFVLGNGEARTLTLLETAAAPLWTNLEELKREQPNGGTLYHFQAKVLADGHPMTLERYVCSQESFYEPYVINGMRVWFDAVADIFDFVTETHGECRPNKAARFAVQEAGRRILAVPLRPWYQNPQLFIDVRDSYNGDDVWMGPYRGASAHGGLDVNLPKGTPAWAPIDFDDQYYFNSLANGDNNNRWRGVKKWPDGEVWTLQNHHLHNLLVAEPTPLEAGTLYATQAGTHVGDHPHSHFVFKVRPAGETLDILLDPWILFWQLFEDTKERGGHPRAVMAPAGPARTGEAVGFAAEGSRASHHGGDPAFYWTFGDGSYQMGRSVQHVFVKPGIYPVTLTVDDGTGPASQTQHVTVDGREVEEASLSLAAPDEPAFRQRPVQAMDVYGVPPARLSGLLEFWARKSRPKPRPKTIELRSPNGRALPGAAVAVRYRQGSGWLSAKVEEGGRIVVEANAAKLPPARYRAVIDITCEGVLNGRQSIPVELTVPAFPPAHRENRDHQREIVDDADDGFYATPWFWVGHRFHKWERKGYREFALANGKRAAAGEFVRFTPDLAAGRHRVRLHPGTPFGEGARFRVRVRHAGGDSWIWMEPSVSLVAGEFEFEEGKDGFAEIHAEGSSGQVVADAVVFEAVAAR